MQETYYFFEARCPSQLGRFTTSFMAAERTSMLGDSKILLTLVDEVGYVCLNSLADISLSAFSGVYFLLVIDRTRNIHLGGSLSHRRVSFLQSDP
ncbi:MAG: hypothetical protein ACRD5E_09575 [Nitrososphaeraceae archaeon]